MLTIAAEDPLSPDAAALIEALTVELSARYHQDGGGRFSPTDAMGPRSTFLIARMNGRAVGCGALRPADESTGEVKRMYVTPEMRGRGIGRRLLAEIESRARSFGYTRIILETGVLQPEAVALYERNGYGKIERYGPSIDSTHSVCFGKNLPPP